MSRELMRQQMVNRALALEAWFQAWEATKEERRVAQEAKLREYESLEKAEELNQAKSQKQRTRPRQRTMEPLCYPSPEPTFGVMHDPKVLALINRWVPLSEMNLL